MKRVLVVNHAAVLGGAELILLDVVAHWGGTRCSVALFADGPLRSALVARGIPVHVMAAGAGMMRVTREAGASRALRSAPAVAAQAWRLARLARHFDGLYANSQKAAVVALPVAIALRKPIVWHMHDILSAAHFAGLQRRLSIRLARLARAQVIVISEAARRSVIAVGGDPARIRVVPNGLDLPAPSPGAAADAAPPLRPPGVAVLVGLFGRISPWKGQAVLVEAIHLLPPDHGAIIVGDALFGEAATLDALRARIAALGLGDRVRLLGHRDDVPALMRAVDVVAHCSTAPEPFGRVIVEAMLAGTPVIASRDGASAEILGDDYPWLAPPGDPDALAAQIRQLGALDAAGRASLVAANQARARERFGLARMLDGIDAVIAGAA